MPESEIALLSYRLDRAEAEIRELHEELEQRAADEKKRLIAGIATLGGVVISLATIILKYIPSGFRG